MVAFEGFANQPGGCRPSCCQQRVVEAQDLVEEDFASAHPIVGQEDHRREHQVDKLEGVRLVGAEHHPGWAVRSLAGP